MGRPPKNTMHPAMEANGIKSAPQAISFIEEAWFHLHRHHKKFLQIMYDRPTILEALQECNITRHNYDTQRRDKSWFGRASYARERGRAADREIYVLMMHDASLNEMVDNLDDYKKAAEAFKILEQINKVAPAPDLSVTEDTGLGEIIPWDNTANG